jgi:hypothetical protein
MSSVIEEAVPSTIDVPCLFAPNWGKQSHLIWNLMAAVQCGEALPTLDQFLGEESAIDESSDGLAVRYSMSLLRDILRAGGSATVRDSRLFVSWPDWSGPEGRNFARRALEQARDLRPLTADEIRRVRPLFSPDLDGETLAEVLKEASFSLLSANEMHPSGIPYQEAFGAALRYWTMPYRGRTGRMKRFVLVASHPKLGEHPVIAGVLELGDEAPFCTWRDSILGIEPQSFGMWLAGDQGAIREKATRVAARMRSIRQCLRPTSSGWDLGMVDARAVVKQRHEIEAASQGRSRVRTDQRELLMDRKRLAYGLRLARGEVAIDQVAHGAEFDPRNPDIAAGVRGFHDLILPRLHLEATVCGAVPPFAQALGGKLMVAFLTHPKVIASTLGAEGELLGWSFDSEKLDKLLPSFGMMCLTTKGLYAGHAAIYNRGEAPGATGAVRMRHLDNTDGNTTSLISTYTTKLARALIESPKDDSVRVSSVYGSGGAKRHRAIEKAAIDVGLPQRLVMAGIRRPVYGLNYVSNAPDVSWLGEEPKWLVKPDEAPAEFCERATKLWRTKWLQRAVDRVHDYALVPSLIRTIETMGQGDA